MDFRTKFKKQNPGLVAEIIRIAKAVQPLPVAEEYRDSLPRALIVGGFVRDAILGVASKDVDIEVFGVDAHHLEDAMNDLFPGKVSVVGRTFGVLKIHVGETEIDVSIPRRESKMGVGHRGFAVTGDPALSYLDASRRRDFTMNAISADPLTGEIFDSCEGQADLKKKMLRVVDPVTFVDDPLRVYRAMQFMARFHLQIESKTKNLLVQMVSAGELGDLSKERITEEFEKLLLRADQPSVGFELLQEIGAIKKLYPELSVMHDTDQEPEWHPEGNVWIHTMMVIDQAAKIIRRKKISFSTDQKRQIMLGALCHDFGKPATTRVIDGRIRSRGHSEEGIPLAHSFFDRFSFSHEDRDAIIKLVKAHLIPGMIVRAKDSGEISSTQFVNSIRKLIRRLSPTDIEVLLAVAEADFRGRAFPTAQDAVYQYGKKIRSAIIKNDLTFSAIQTLVRGEDCIKLGIPSGPRIGELLSAVESARDRGEITTKSEGLDLLRTLIQRS